MTDIDLTTIERLAEIAALRLGDDVADPVIQALVDRAADELGLPMAAVSIVLDTAQYFIASHGLEGWIGVVQGTPGEWAFCRSAITTRQPFVVEDSGTHTVVRDNPLTTIDGVRSYLGIPLITSKNRAIGTLCVLGVETRQFSQADLTKLAELADRVLTELEARRQQP